MRIKELLKNRLLDYVEKNKNYIPENNHFIFGDPRGGSTWLMEIVEKITNEPVVWEPLDPRVTDDSFRNLNFGWYQYIPEGEKWPEAKKAFDNLFTGNTIDEYIFRNSNTYKFNTARRLITSKSILFKFVRGNMILPWLVNNYEFKFKPIYIIRHPFAVVASQLKHGGWKFPYDEFYIPDIPFNQIYVTNEKFLKTFKTKEEALTAQWCLNNELTLKSINNNVKWLTFNYEEFISEPKRSVERIISEWGISYNLDKIDFRKKSVTTKEGSSTNAKVQIARWQKSFSNEQITRMKEVLDCFEVEVYDESPYPKIVYNYGD